MPELIGFVNNIKLMFFLHGLAVVIVLLVGTVIYNISKTFIR
jgi:hypothetical protein